MMRAFVLVLVCASTVGSLPGPAGVSATSIHAASARQPPLHVDEVTIATAFDVLTLDPHRSADLASFRVMRQIYDTLVEHDEHLELRSGLAAAWERLDPTTWVFRLRPGVVFHDGTPLRAGDVVRSLERLRDPRTAAPAAFLIGMLDTIEAIEDDAVRITTHRPFAPLPSHLAHPATSILSEATLLTIDGDDADPDVAVGTGPFRLVRWDRPSQVVLERSESWWGGPVGPGRLVFRTVPEALVRSIELEVGAADVAYQLQPHDAARLAGSERVVLHAAETLLTHYLGFDTSTAPFDDVRLRRAVAHALDVEAIVDAIFAGTATRARGPLPAATFGARNDLEPAAHDPAAARALIADAGAGDGLGATLWAVHDGLVAQAAEIVQAQLAEVGIDVRIELADAGTFLSETAAGRHDLFLLGWGTVTGDADYGLYGPFHSSRAGAGGNRAFYANARVDHLLDLARETDDEAERREAYHEAQRLIHEDVPWVYLAVPLEVTGVRAHLAGFTPHASGLHRLHGIGRR